MLKHAWRDWGKHENPIQDSRSAWHLNPEHSEYEAGMLTTFRMNRDWRICLCLRGRSFISFTGSPMRKRSDLDMVRTWSQANGAFTCDVSVTHDRLPLSWTPAPTDARRYNCFARPESIGDYYSFIGTHQYSFRTLFYLFANDSVSYRKLTVDRTTEIQRALPLLQTGHITECMLKHSCWLIGWFACDRFFKIAIFSILNRIIFLNYPALINDSNFYTLLCWNFQYKSVLKFYFTFSRHLWKVIF